MLDLFQKLGHKTLGRFAALGRSAYMLFSALAHVPNFKKGTPPALYGWFAIVTHYYGVGFVYRYGVGFTRLHRIGWLWR